MEYIDKGEAIYAATMAVGKCIPILQGHNAKVSLEVTRAIHTMPSIDLDDYIPRAYYNKVVEELCRKHTEEIASMPTIVRCKECKHNYSKERNHGKMQPRCDFTDWKLKENDFCSRGEREQTERSE